MKSWKNIVNKLRKKYAKKNGVVSGYVLDHPDYERLIYNHKKHKKSKYK